MQWEIDLMTERDKKDGRYNYQLLEDGINLVGMREDHGTQETLAGFRFFRFFIGTFLLVLHSSSGVVLGNQFGKGQRQRPGGHHQLGRMQKHCLLPFGVDPQTLEQCTDVQSAHPSQRSTHHSIGTSEGDAGLVGSLKDHIGRVLVFDFHTIWGEAVVRTRHVHITVKVNGKREGKYTLPWAPSHFFASFGIVQAQPLEPPKDSVIIRNWYCYRLAHPMIPMQQSRANGVHNGTYTIMSGTRTGDRRGPPSLSEELPIPRRWWECRVDHANDSELSFYHYHQLAHFDPIFWPKFTEFGDYPSTQHLYTLSLFYLSMTCILWILVHSYYADFLAEVVVIFSQVIELMAEFVRDKMTMPSAVFAQTLLDGMKGNEYTVVRLTYDCINLHAEVSSERGVEWVDRTGRMGRTRGVDTRTMVVAESSDHTEQTKEGLTNWTIGLKGLPALKPATKGRTSETSQGYFMSPTDMPVVSFNSTRPNLNQKHLVVIWQMLPLPQLAAAIKTVRNPTLEVQVTHILGELFKTYSVDVIYTAYNVEIVKEPVVYLFHPAEMLSEGFCAVQ
ncbi:hypothetical protein DFH07DRAFT_770001 [Mycena maculata]|uniref:Uncharacterized protein n=1 Tax=Mycena maculata TaxID=230809 RepID=A0AAD7JLJ9_9AGAR|nr:hypothetical protein DFH07DRAFT_770001 [Mycena maculata]